MFDTDTLLLCAAALATGGFIKGIAVLTITMLTSAVPGLRVGPRLERVLSPLVGTLSGLLGGASSLFGPPIMIYLLSLRLERDEYISAVSLIYLVAASLFTLSLIAVGALGWVQAWYSTLGMIPVFGGMLIGQLIGARLGRRAFERALTGLYVLTALTFFYKAFA